MKCLMCEEYSLTHICSSCQEVFLTPSLYKRKLSNGIEVISFYKYSDIKDLLHTKHTDLGFYIYNILAKLSFTKFATEFHVNFNLVSLSIDDTIDSGYSHTAILNRHLKSKNITPKYKRLRAQNRTSYSGKSRQFRLLHPRNFKLQDFKETDVILIDDIITTGLTLTQAINTLHKENKNVLFCLTLADVQQK